MLTVHQIINAPVASNCFVVFDKTIGNECIVIDPGSKSDDVLFGFFEKENLTPKYIILTHEHFDHCWGVNELVEKYHIPIICSNECSNSIRFEKRNCSVFYDNKEAFIITSKTISVESLDYHMQFVGFSVQFFPSAGHTKSSVCFIVGSCLFSGDTLIKDLKTVTKLPTGSIKDLLNSKQKLEHLQGAGYQVYPGHGDVFELDSYNLERMLH